MDSKEVFIASRHQLPVSDLINVLFFVVVLTLKDINSSLVDSAAVNKLINERIQTQSSLIQPNIS